MTCECDFDCVGDPAHYVRSNHSTLCPEHDMCSICDDAKAVLIVNGDKCCKDCALEDITTCPNCGWETNFTEHSSVSREYHGETQDEEWLTCNHCGKETDEAELQRHRLARMAGIQKQLAELGLA